MKLLLAPTKTMRVRPDVPPPASLPALLEKAELLLAALRGLSEAELKALYSCSDAIAAENARRFAEMDLRKNLTPAVYAFEGLAFQHIAADELDEGALAYLEAHLRILSGFYGVLRPMDGIRPYRLDLEDPLALPGCKNLYAFWGALLSEQVQDDVVVNLASKEYAKAVEKHLTPGTRFITCQFTELIKGKRVQKATFSKMARGEMVRFLAERRAESPEALRDFDRLGFTFSEEASTDSVFVFDRA